MEKICWKGHAAMFGANAMWGLMSPISKFIMLGGADMRCLVDPLAGAWIEILHCKRLS